MKILITILALCFLILAALIFRPVPIPDNAEDCLVAEGRVTHIFEGGVKDVVFRLANDETTYYINRGLEQGLNLENLKETLIGNHVKILYPDYWTPLNPNSASRHLTILEYNGKDIYNEIALVKSRIQK